MYRFYGTALLYNMKCNCNEAFKVLDPYIQSVQQEWLVFIRCVLILRTDSEGVESIVRFLH